jgi:hypothetical protein
MFSCRSEFWVRAHAAQIVGRAGDPRLSLAFSLDTQKLDCDHHVTYRPNRSLVCLLPFLYAPPPLHELPNYGNHGKTSLLF